MRPETELFLAKARNDLADARTVASIGLASIAARSAYFVAFHAAEAYIFERSGKVAKTHSGVRSEFARLARASSGIGKPVSAFLGEAYKFKEISDYGLDQRESVTIEEANAAIVNAELFLSIVAASLEFEA